MYRFYFFVKKPNVQWSMKRNASVSMNYVPLGRIVSVLGCVLRRCSRRCRIRRSDIPPCILPR